MPVLNLYDLTGRVALITGARGGIGVGFVEAFAAAGASVAAADLPGEPLDAVYAGFRNAECHGSFYADLTDPAQAERLVAEVAARYGHVDILVNSAAILEVAPVLEVKPDSWQRTLNVNLTGTLLICQAAARQMVRQGRGGRLIAIASNVGRIPRLNNVSYAVSKAGVIHMMRCFALELAQYNITANALCPGSTATPMLIANQAKGDPRRLDGIIRGSLEQWRTGIPLGKLAEPEDQAALAVFLASDGARHITGQTLTVDGGQTLF